MKKINRWLAVMMCMCMLCTSVLGDLQPVFAEGVTEIADAASEEIIEAAPEEPDPTEMSTEEPTTEPTAVPTEEPTAEPAADPTSEPVLELGGGSLGEMGSDANEVRAQIPAEKETAQSPGKEVFSFGYAAVTDDAELYAQFNALTEVIAQIKADGIVLVTERKTEAGLDRVRVNFAYEEVAEEAWMDAAMVEPLTEEEAEAFLDSVTEAICYQDDAAYPLPVPEIVLPEIVTAEPTMEPAAEKTAEPETEITVEPEVTEMPEITAEPEVSVEPENTVVPEVTEEPTATEEVQATSQPAEDAEESAGNADIDAATEDRPAVMMKTALYSVRNEAGAVTMNLEQASAELKVGDSIVIKPEFSDGGSYNVGYMLSESGIVEVDGATGTLTALAVGEATVLVKCSELSDVSAEFTATVVEGEAEIQESTEEENVSAAGPIALEMLVGDSRMIDFVIPEGMTGRIEYTASPENVVTVDETGAVTAVGAGECTITATLVNDGISAADASVMRLAEVGAEDEESVPLTAVYNVKVYEIAEAAEIAAALTEELNVGQTAQITAELTTSSQAQLNYKSSDEKVATVDASGVVTAVGRGECTIDVSIGELSSMLPLKVYSLPEDFELTVSDAVLSMGETAQLAVELPEYTRGEVVYGVLNPLVAGVDRNGLVMANHPGVCELTATIGNVTRSVQIEVYGKPNSIELVVEQASLPVGYRTQASVSLGEYMVDNIEIVSSDPSIASVDANGIVTAVSVGFCEIIARTADGLESKVLFSVVDSVLDLKTKYSEIAVGQGFVLGYTVSDAAYAQETAVFSTSDETVAKVDEKTGAVTAVGEGEAVITVMLPESGVSAECYVTVRKAPTRIVISTATKTIGKGQITSAIGYTLYAGDEPTVGSVSFKSSNTKVVKVNAKGQMQGVKAGTAKITVTAYNKNVYASFNVTVKNAPKSLKISPTAATMAVGQRGRVKYTLNSNTAAGISYKSSNANVVQVDSAGYITAVGVGTAKIRVFTHNGLSKYCTITVKKAPENVTLKASAAKLGVDMTTSVVPAVDTSSTIAFTYRYWTDQPEILSVNETTGAVKALQPGTASVFVETYNNVTSHATADGREETSVQITVVPKPDKVAVANTKFNLMVGRKMKLPVTMTMADGSTECLTTYKLSTSNSKIVAVNSSGQIKGIKAGTATVTVAFGTGKKIAVTVVVRAKATKLVLNKSSATLGVGMSTTLATRVYYSSSKYFNYSAADALGIGVYASNKPEVASVDSATGQITALSPGTAKIAFTTYNGKKAYCNVTVMGVPTAVDMNADALKLGVDMTSTLKAVFKPYELGPVTFSSSAETIATVHPTSGLVKAVGPGVATITISAGDGITNTCEVTVVPKPDNVTVPAKFNLMVSRTMKLPVTMTMADGSTECLTTYKLSTSNSKIVAVNSSGQIKGVKAGTATVTVTAASGQKVKATVVVRAKPTKLLLNKKSMTLGVGMSGKLITRVYYSSSKYFDYSAADAPGIGQYITSNANVAKVDAATGEITAVSVGTAKIAFKTHNGKAAYCTVTVKNAPTSVGLNKTTVTLGEQLTTTIAPVFNAGEHGSVSYSCDNTDVAAVNSSGKIAGLKAGMATVTATTHNGETAQCVVTVKPAPDNIALNITASNMAIGGKITLKATCTYEGSDDCIAQLSYKSSNTKVATVSSSGVVKGVKAGSATIRVYAQNNTYRDCKVVVRKKPTKVAFGSSSVYLGVGQSASVSAKIYYSGGSCNYSVNDTSYARLTFSDPTIAKLDSTTGRIVGLEVGGTYATLTTYNGKSARCKIYVSPGPEWIEFDEPFRTMSVGESVTMSCTQSAGSIATLSYSSSDSTVVKVSGNGTTACKMTALKQGTAVVTATSSNGQVSTCEVTVMAAPKTVQFAQSAMTISIGETAKLPKVTVSSDEGECSQVVAYTASSTAVSLPSPGYVTGVKAGTAVITASTGGKSATCTVTVLPETTVIEVEPEESVIAVGDTTQLKVQMDYTGGYTFEVDDDSIVSVSENGKVTALKPGTAKITATSYNNLTASCTIKVLAAPEQVRIEKDELTLNQGASAQLTASIPENTLGKLKFVSTNENVVAVQSHCSVSINAQGKANVDAYGVLTAKAPGTAMVQVYVEGHADVFDTCEVNVLAKPAKVEISRTGLTLCKGATASLEAVLTGANGAKCYGSAVFASSNNGVASVSKAGVITANSAGEAVITVSADVDSSVKAQCKVIVTNASVGFDVSELQLGAGESYKLRVDLPNGKNGFSIVSSAAGVATVDPQTFEIEAIAPGTAKITAKNGGDEAVCTVNVTSKPTSIKLSAAEKRLAIGKEFTLTATPQPAGTASKLYFTTSNKAVATVTSAGIVKAIGYGSAVIRAANHDGSLYAECTVTVVYEPERVRFGELEDIVIAVGDSYTLEEPYMYNSRGESDSTYTLAISNSNCARISLENGRYVLRALSEGEATLRLKTANGKTDTHRVVVVKAPGSIHFANDVISMAAGETCKPVVMGSNGAEVSVTLTVSGSDAAVLRINADGELEAVSAGTANVTAVSKQFPALRATTTVRVLNAPESISLNEGSAVLGAGERMKLVPTFNAGASAANVFYTSNDETVVQAGRDGTILAVGTGTATVTARTFNGCTASCKVTVLAAPTEVRVQPESIAACVRDRVQLNVEFGSELEHGGVEYETSNAWVADVTDGGLVTFKAVGETVITVRSYNGLTAQVPVKVSETPSSVRFNPESAVMLAGDSAKLNIVFDRGAGYFTLTSSDSKTVSVAADGTVTAHKPGRATITLNMPALNLSARCTIDVVAKLSGMNLTAADNKTTLELHETVQLNCRLVPENLIGSGGLSYVSSAPAVASVDAQTGLVTGQSYGTAVITARTLDGQSASIKINVLGGKRRMMIAYYFGEVGDSGYLTFAYNNGYSMQQAFSAATVEGRQYDIKGPMSNAPKSTLLGTIDSHFADATDDDVSVIYICAHGSSSFGPTGEYNFLLDNTHRVMASELMNRLERIKGRVVLIMDSCHAGGIIDCNKARLDAQGGRISILASSHRNTNSCYWSVKEKLAAFDFFTHALLQGVGFNESSATGNGRGWFRDAGGPADDAGNADGQVTVQELFDYAKSLTVRNIANASGRAEFRGNPAQVPQSYIGSMNRNLVLFARE